MTYSGRCGGKSIWGHIKGRARWVKDHVVITLRSIGVRTRFEAPPARPSSTATARAHSYASGTGTTVAQQHSRRSLLPTAVGWTTADRSMTLRSTATTLITTPIQNGGRSGRRAAYAAARQI